MTNPTNKQKKSFAWNYEQATERRKAENRKRLLHDPSFY